MFFPKAQYFRFIAPFFIITLCLVGCMEMASNDSPSNSAGSSFVGTAPEQPIETTLDMIDYDLEAGKLSPIEAIELRGYFFMAPEQLPLRYQFSKLKIIKSATSYIRDVHDHWSELSPRAQEIFSKALARPTLQHYYDTPGGHFRIHYDTTGNHAVYQPTVDNNGNGVPDYVDAVAESADYCWIEETTAGGNVGLNYDPPANDGAAGGGTDLYDFYLQKYSGAYGVTFPEGTASTQYPGRNARETYIFIDPAYQNFGYQDRTLPMKVTVAHEFFHAIQFIYNANSDVWYWETSSVWMEDILYPSINDYFNYLRSRFKQPYSPLKDTSLMYGTVIWNQFLHQYHNDIGIVKKVWEQMISTSNAYSSLDAVLINNYGQDLRTAFQHYTQWNYITGKHDDGQHYQDGAAWANKLQNKEVWVARDYVDGEYPVTSEQPANSPQPMGANYFRFTVNAGMPGFKITFDGNDAIRMGASVIIGYNNGTYSESILDLGDTNQGTFEVSDLTNINHFVLIPQNLQWGGTGGAVFTYGATYLSSLAAPSGLTAASTIYSTFAGAKQYVFLDWDHNTEPTLAGYNLYRATQSGGSYSKVNGSPMTGTYYLDKNLDPSIMYYYVVKAVDAYGQESPSSNEVHS